MVSECREPYEPAQVLRWREFLLYPPIHHPPTWLFPLMFSPLPPRGTAQIAASEPIHLLRCVGRGLLSATAGGRPEWSEAKRSLGGHRRDEGERLQENGRNSKLVVGG